MPRRRQKHHKASQIRWGQRGTVLPFPAAAPKLRFDTRTRIDAPQRSVPVSVVMIVKNCAESARKCLESLKRTFLRPQDEIVVVDTGSTDNTPRILRNMGARIISRPDLRKNMGELVERWLPEWYEKFKSEPQFTEGCLLNFAEARQVGTDAAKNDIVFWIDADDILQEEQPYALRDTVDRFVGDKCDAIFLNYLYAFDPADKRVTTVLKRERIVDRRAYYWKGRCHETMIPKEGASLLGPGWFPDLPSQIVHADARQDHTLSDIRNYCIIRNEVEEDLAAGKQPDVRSIFYLGNACRGLKRHGEALSMYAKTLQLSGSRDDRYSAAYYSGLTYLQKDIQRPLDALDYGFQCLKIKPEDPRGYFLISRCYHLLNRHKDSLHWYQTGRLLPEPNQSVHNYDPEHVASLPLMVAMSAARELKDEGLLQQLGTELARSRPDHPDVNQILQDAQNWMAGQQLIRSVRSIAANARPRDSRQAAAIMRDLVAKLPELPSELEESGTGRIEGNDPRRLEDVTTYVNEAGETVTERHAAATLDKDLVIFCGKTEERWGPANAKTGIGGSEKAVIHMAPRLQARGFRVTVYASIPPDQRGIDKETGVLWRHWSEIDLERPRGTVIFWRCVSGLEAPLPARRRIVWLHDVQRPHEWSDVRCALADEVWVLSEYHKTTLGPAVIAKLGDKVKITRNGIDTALFESCDKLWPTRKANRVVYCSSPDRGVMTAIKAFQEATKGDPTAELHVCYGFNKLWKKQAADIEYGHIPDLGRDCNMHDYMRTLYHACDKDERIKYHGRLNWEKLAELMSTSGVWLYPTRFPEISCMSAMEAMAAGCAVVATDYAALKETVLWDKPACRKVVEPGEARDRLGEAIDITCALDREEIAKAAREAYSYDSLADDWTQRLSVK